MSATSLAPGFRFHPTDEELVRYYLRRKVCGKSFRFNAISEVDVYRAEPWDLPGKSMLKSRDLEWYFFSVLDKKYGNGSRTNRATEHGYWKTTGKDRAVYHNSQTAGMKKTLVYHSGRAPRGNRTNWVMHEYRLIDGELEKAGIVQDAFVLCRIFQKSGSGPKNGEQYGAPFVEEEWEEDEIALVPSERVADEREVSDDAYVEMNDLEQNLDTSVPPGNAPFSLDCYFGDTSNHVGDSKDITEDDQKPIVGMGEEFDLSKLLDDQQCFDVPEHYELDTYPVTDEQIVDSNNKMDPVDSDYLLDEPYFDANDIPSLDEGFFLETNDLSNNVEADSSSLDMLEEYLAYYDADDGNSLLMLPDCPDMVTNECINSDAKSLMQQHLDGEVAQSSMTGQQVAKAQGNGVASSSDKTSEDAIFPSDIKNSLARQATRLLGNIPARPAYAAEFPSKDVALKLASLAKSPSSVHVTAQMIETRDTTNGFTWSFDKNGNLEVLLSFPLRHNEANSGAIASLLSGKTLSAMSRSWFYLVFFGISILSISFRFGSFICAK